MVVAVDGGFGSVDALDWAAAQAMVCGAELRIVHAFHAPSALDPFALVAATGIEFAAIGTAASVVDDAAARVRYIAPEVAVTTRIMPGSSASAILQEAPPSALVVLGRPVHGSSRGRTVAKVLGRSRGPVAVVSFVGEIEPGPSGGRVVLAYDGERGSETAVDVAFREARRRGIDLTALLLDTAPRQGVRLDRWRQRFPEVAVRDEVVTGPVGQRIVAESHGAALLVLPEAQRPHRPFRRRLRPWARAVVETAASPILLVPDRHS
ncbi:hypothetical protein A6A27_40825 [Micromonospora sp. CB01531]|nr:hypothetical protein A6A27_40825 [Micromonospora sp. CB01531]